METDEALRRRLSVGETKRGTKDGVFFALRELHPELGVVIMENLASIKKPSLFDRIFRPWRLRKVEPHKRQQVTIYLYAPAGVVIDGSDVANVLRANMPAGISYHTVFCGGL